MSRDILERFQRPLDTVRLVDLTALRTFKCIPLQIECLIIGRDASVANAHVANPKNNRRLWIAHFGMASATDSAVNSAYFSDIEACDR